MLRTDFPETFEACAACPKPAVIALAGQYWCGRHAPNRPLFTCAGCGTTYFRGDHDAAECVRRVQVLGVPSKC